MLMWHAKKIRDAGDKEKIKDFLFRITKQILFTVETKKNIEREEIERFIRRTVGASFVRNSSRSIRRADNVFDEKRYPVIK